MYALDATTGAILWSFASGGEVRSGAAIVGAKVYWGSGYRGGHNNKLYAFGLPAGVRHSDMSEVLPGRLGRPLPGH
jgi:outer membrane protein assembly factor BamB